MPTVEVRVEDFGGPLAQINGLHSFDVSKQQCLKAAISVGLPMLADASPSSAHAVALASYKALTMKCALDFSRTSVCRPVEHAKLDQSEKVNISYWTGMTFAAIVAEKFLNVPRLLHASTLRRRGLLRTKGDSRSLADLVGQDQAGQWHVVEAKGRGDYPSTAERNGWKVQASTVRSINGKRPFSCSYSLACVGHSCYVELVDPAPDDGRDEGADLSMDPREVTAWHYSPIREWLATGAGTIRRGGHSIRARILGFDPVDAEYVFLEASGNS